MTISVETVSVTVARKIAATPEQVYRALTTRDDLVQWFCNNALLQVQENGAYLFVWNAEQFSATGIFKKVEENKALDMTWRSAWKGKSEADDSTYRIAIEADGAGSTVTLTHSDISPEGQEGYEGQWNKHLDDLKQYLETGAVPNIVNRVIIGIFPSAVSAKRAAELGLKEGHGTHVSSLVAGLGAEKAGLQADDVIVAMDGQEVTPQTPMNVLVQGKKPGDPVEVTFYRGAEKQSRTMNLSGYPVPPIPHSFAELVENAAEQFDIVFKDLSALFDGVSEEAAGKAPAEGEWSAKLVLCHLIYGERWNHEATGGRITGGQPQHWSGNHNARLQAILDVYPTTQDLLSALRREYDETLALWRNFPQDIAVASRTHLWNEGFGVDGNIQHTRGHFAQIQAAIQAARA